ncbi:hypothetical protein LTR10_012757 [Elasticomyces elasticus]|uniref:Capsule polysaccharide biosynthesis protein n=1 Tax=Exophiala sideris TaxID=1016849 RepID=A0ABR0JR43_9EURO|nr:hypothetical protein LTR10_012757 [Elasticomyces elasticus]KAK5034634.1 hypothetical protein LTR13_006290 [Exophiala sideris]KAK5040044.1 hypothetical protein LTS07_000540 [Exophiala sideris]KAK5068422.1 hypothetical protein LTR69_000541 [Exophiala sideris]KAK5187724.1 hypothetical protein LTR44_000541 [Eurotiomycetes sp. CCFEE 6388]
MSSSASLAIPSEFKDQLRYVEPLDKRSEEEAFASLDKHAPVTSEKNIWAFWDKGAQAMPDWCKRNIVDWFRLCGPSWTIRILNAIPDSPNYALNFVSADLLPRSFVDGTMTGPCVGPHSADFLRGACLWTHGGVYMDVGIILIRNLDRICWNQLADPESPYQVAAPIMYATTMANHFVASRKGEPFIKHWHDLFVFLWKDRQNHEGIIGNPLVAFALQNTFQESQAADYHWEFKVEPQVVFEYIGQVLSWMRLCMLEDTGNGFSGVDYWQKHVLLFDALQEDWGAEATVGFAGQSLFDALATKLTAPKDSEEYKTAYKLVWRLLTKSSMQKITHGKNLTTTSSVGVLWEEKGNENKDHEPGTFAQLLRYGCVHFEQTRESINYVKAKKPPMTMHKGLLEP